MLLSNSIGKGGEKGSYYIYMKHASKPADRVVEAALNAIRWREIGFLPSLAFPPGVAKFVQECMHITVVYFCWFVFNEYSSLFRSNIYLPLGMHNLIFFFFYLSRPNSSYKLRVHI